MKICFIGMGSIGKRHLINLITITSKLGINLEVDLLRKTNTPLPEEIENVVQCIYSDFDTLPNDYEIIFITNPTSEHYNTIMKVSEKSKALFIEKPVFHKSDLDIKNFVDSSRCLTYVAAPLRFHPVISELKNIIQKEKIYSVRAICSSYLPNWRKGVDYKTVYSAHKDQGGGVAIDLIHEWDYLCYLFGKPLEVHKIAGKFSHLEINSEDLAIYIAKYQDKMIELHLDYFGRKTRRNVELISENGLIIGDITNSEIIFEDERKSLKFDFDTNKMYLDEIIYFYNCYYHQEMTNNNIENALETLKLTEV